MLTTFKFLLQKVTTITVVLYITRKEGGGGGGGEEEQYPASEENLCRPLLEERLLYRSLVAYYLHPFVCSTAVFHKLNCYTQNTYE